MIVSLIAAVDKNFGIGINNDMPWGRIKEDMAFFKDITLGSTVIMGRKTFESIGNKPLPGRKNIVLSRTKHETYDNIYGNNLVFLSSFENALSIEIADLSREVFIMGGESIYREGMKYADRLYITHIPAKFDCDRYFPSIDENIFKKEKIKTIEYSNKETADIFMYYNY